MKQPFDFWDKNAQLSYDKGNVRIYTLNREDYLFVDQTLYASSTETSWYIRNILLPAKGNVLEIGLGLGCASKIMLSNPKLEKILTIEKNPYVIAAFGSPMPRHKIVQADINEWLAGVPKEPRYDFIFVDHYTNQDEDTFEELRSLKSNLKKILKKQGKIIFWYDNNLAPEEKKAIKSLWV